MLAGIGFTVSLLVSDLSFDGRRTRRGEDGRAGRARCSRRLLGALLLGHRDRLRLHPDDRVTP